MFSTQMCGRFFFFGGGIWQSIRPTALMWNCRKMSLQWPFWKYSNQWPLALCGSASWSEVWGRMQLFKKKKKKSFCKHAAATVGCGGYWGSGGKVITGLSPLAPTGPELKDKLLLGCLRIPASWLPALTACINPQQRGRSPYQHAARINRGRG